MQQSLGKFEERGLRVVAIGQATGAEARSFCDEWGVEYPCVGDPRRRGYRSLGFGRGGWWNIAVRSLVTNPIETVRLIGQADRRGAQLKSTDIFQLGGIAIVDRGGTVRALHRAQSPQDMPSVEEVLGFDWQAPLP